MSVSTNSSMARLLAWATAPRGAAAVQQPGSAPIGGASAPTSSAAPWTVDLFTPSAATAASANPKGGSGDGTYTVRSGDTLSAIAQRTLGSSGSWQAIYNANRDKISNPNMIYPGMVLTIPGGGASAPAPAPAAGGTYTVQSGDSLSAIAQRTLGSAGRWQEIYNLNRDKISNPNQIYVGEVLTLPGGASSPAPTPSTPGSYSESWSPSPGTLHGADTSSWQSQGTFEQSIAGTEFSVIKASEGTGFVDPTFASRWAELGQKVASGQMKLRMAYVFLDAGTSGTAQAQHFLDTVGVHGPLPAGTRLVIDWEGSALNHPQELTDCANYIHSVTGLWPLIYTQGSEVSAARNAVPQAPIWEAAWGPSPNPNYPFVQYSDGPGYDHDVFNGDTAALAKFAGWS